MIVLLAIALLLLMTPIWVHLAIDASGGQAVAGDPGSAHDLSDRTVNELFVGPGTFAYFGADEAGHMRDVRLILFVFLGAAFVSLVLLMLALARSPRDPGIWGAIGRGGLTLAGVLVVLGAFAAVAFDTAFELFHRLLFPGGNFEFPATSALIRLYPEGFWELSAAAIGVLGIVFGLLVWFVVRARARRLENT